MASRGALRAVQACAVGALAVLTTLAVIVPSGDDDSGGPPTYTVVEDWETGRGVEAVVSVNVGGVPEDVLADVLEDHPYGKVTLVCEGRDLEEDGWDLVSTVEDGRRVVVVPHADQVC